MSSGGVLSTRILSIGVFVFLGVLVFAASPGAARETVRFKGYSAGTIAGQAWAGRATIDGKYISPAWQAPESIRKDYAKLPPVVPGGSPSNPMGAAAMTLSGGGQYAIHGTNNPGSIGGFVSHGCIRMYNQDIMDLYARVSVGTEVVVLR